MSYENLTEKQASILSNTGFTEEQIIDITNRFAELYKKIKEFIEYLHDKFREIFSTLNKKFILKQLGENKIVFLPRPQKYLNSYKPVIIRNIKRLDKLYTRGNRKRGYEQLI